MYVSKLMQSTVFPGRGARPSQADSQLSVRRGFTLVEMSLVLAIIALIAGGILVGQMLVRAADIRATIADLNDFTSRMHLFKQQYGYFPGDYPEASANLQAGMFDGDGNAFVLWDHEVLCAWMHLYYAHLSPFGTLIWNGAGSPPTTEQVIPPARFPRGYYWFIAIPSSAYGDAPVLSNYFMIATEHVGVASDWDGPVPPKDAFSLDTKLDDAVPNKGRLRAAGGYLTGLSGRPCLVSGHDRVFADQSEEYDLITSDAAQCRVFFLPFE